MNDVISDAESFLPGITLLGIRLLEEKRVIRQTETVPTQAAH